MLELTVFIFSCFGNYAVLSLKPTVKEREQDTQSQKEESHEGLDKGLYEGSLEGSHERSLERPHEGLLEGSHVASHEGSHKRLHDLEGCAIMPTSSRDVTSSQGIHDINQEWTLSKCSTNIRYPNHMCDYFLLGLDVVTV